MTDRLKLFVNKIEWKRIILTLCVLGIEGVEVVYSDLTYEPAAIAVNMLGIFLFPFVLLRYKLKDFYKWYYLAYSVTGVAAISVIYKLFAYKDVFASRFLVAEIDVFLFGFFFIKLIEETVLKIKAKSFKGIPALIVGFTVFCLLCTFSVNNSKWALWFLVLFVPFYGTKLDEKERDIEFRAIVDGLLIGFFVIQSMAFLYRPYSEPRYGGMFFNSNINSLFYVVSYIAALTKLHILREENKSKLYRGIIFVLCGGLWSFEVLTIGRCSILAFVVATIVFLLIEEIYYRKNGLKGFFCQGVLLAFAFILSFLPAYGLARYVPQLRHHPIFFFDEYDSPRAIHSDEIGDNSKYVSLGDFAKYFSGRLDTEKIEKYAYKVNEVNAEADGSAVPYFDKAEYNGAFEVFLGIRKYIWNYFFTHIKFMGYVESYESIYLLPSYYVNHPHNSFIFIAYSFGILPGIMFALWVLAVPVIMVRKYIKKCHDLTWHHLFVLLSYVGFFVYGFFETVSYPGRTIFFMILMTASIFVKQDTKPDLQE